MKKFVKVSALSLGLLAAAGVPSIASQIVEQAPSSLKSGAVEDKDVFSKMIEASEKKKDQDGEKKKSDSDVLKGAVKEEVIKALKDVDVIDALKYYGNNFVEAVKEARADQEHGFFTKAWNFVKKTIVNPIRDYVFPKAIEVASNILKNHGEQILMMVIQMAILAL